MLINQVKGERFMGIFDRFRKSVVAEEKPMHYKTNNTKFNVAAGLPNIFKETEKLRQDTNYVNKFDLYDNMMKLDPELNGAVRSVSLTANNYKIDFKSAKNQRIRKSPETGLF